MVEDCRRKRLRKKILSVTQWPFRIGHTPAFWFRSTMTTLAAMSLLRARRGPPARGGALGGGQRPALGADGPVVEGGVVGRRLRHEREHLARRRRPERPSEPLQHAGGQLPARLRVAGGGHGRLQPLHAPLVVGERALGLGPDGRGQDDGGPVQLRALVGGHHGHEGHLRDRVHGLGHPQDLRPLQHERLHRAGAAGGEDRVDTVPAHALVEAALRVRVAVGPLQHAVDPLPHFLLGVADPEVELAADRVGERLEREDVLVRRPGARRGRPRRSRPPSGPRPPGRARRGRLRPPSRPRRGPAPRRPARSRRSPCRGRGRGRTSRTCSRRRCGAGAAARPRRPARPRTRCSRSRSRGRPTRASSGTRPAS